MTYVPIQTLPPGSRFRTESGCEGELLYANDCRARVRLGSERKKTVTKSRPGLTDNGEQLRVSFEVTQPAEEANISPNTMVTVA